MRIVSRAEMMAVPPRTRGCTQSAGADGAPWASGWSRPRRTVPPRTRGCTLAEDPVSTPSRRFPRARGDAPRSHGHLQQDNAVPPRTRGCEVPKSRSREVESTKSRVVGAALVAAASLGP